MKPSKAGQAPDKTGVDQEKYLLMSDADRIAQHLIEKIRNFWKVHSADIEHGKYRFKEQSLSKIVEELDRY